MAGFTAKYGTVERALSIAFGIPETVRAGSFRSWLGSLQRAGFLGEQARVGRGAPLVYQVDQIRRLVVALELAELGCPPAVILALIETHWKKRIIPVFVAAENVLERDGGEAPSDNDVVLLLVATRFRSGVLAGTEPVPDIRHTTMGDLSKVMAATLRGAAGDPAPRVLAINLSARLRVFHDALIEAQRVKEEPQEEPVTVRKLKRAR